ncbi:MAG: biotin/lipoate A/B protein ligase family protein [Leptonema sp. (in: bacteria)]
MIIEIPDLKIRNPYISIAIEEVLAEYYSQQSDFSGLLRFWLNPPTIVLGRTCKIYENIKLESFVDIAERNIKIVRRLSGGGTVYHSYGNLNYTIILPINKHKNLISIPESYQILLNMLVRSLEKQNIHARILGLSDLAIEKDAQFKKISGNSQFRKYGMLVHHGTLILNASILEEINQILKHPPKEPDYRHQRTHKEFLTNLPEDFDISLFYDCMLNELKQYLNMPYSRFVYKEEFKEMSITLKEKVKKIYKTSQWIYNGIYEPIKTIQYSH